MIEPYVKNPDRFEWLDLFNRMSRSSQNTNTLSYSSLYKHMHLVKGNLYDVCKISLYKDYKSKNLTDLILNEKNNGIVVMILEDENGTTSHAVGINVRRRLFFDCMEKKSLVLEKGNLSICCGVNSVLRRIKRH